MRNIIHKSLIITLFASILLPSYSDAQVGANKDVLINEMVEILSSRQEDGDTMLYALDSLQSLGINFNNIALPYATAYGLKGEYDKAIQILKENISSSTKPQLFYQEMGGIFLLKGDTAEAISAYNEAIKCNPNYARPYIYLAELFSEQKKYDLAVDNYLSAVCLFSENGFFEEMKYYADRAMLLDPTNIELGKYLQYYYVMENNHQMVLKVGLDIEEHRIVQKEYDGPYEHLVFMGMSFYNLQKYEDALSVFKKAIEHNTEAQAYEYVIYCYSSACFNKLGNKEAAKDFLEAAKGVYPEEAEGYIQEILNMVKD